MASTYSTNLALELIGTGEQSGTWGTTTNTNLGTLLEQAISGYVTQAITDGSSANTTITIPNGTTGVARNMFIEMTGALSFSTTSLIVPANKKMYFIFNNTSGGFAVTVKVSGQTGILVPNGKKVILTSNGTDIVEAANQVVGNFAVGGTFSATGTSTMAAINASGLVAMAGAATVGTTLGVTGTSTMAAINASGIIASSASAGAVTLAPTTGTAAVYVRIFNTGGENYLGVDSSTNSVFGNGAYDLNIYSASQDIHLSPAGTKMLSLTSTGVTIPGTLAAGATTVTGTLSATGTVTAGKMVLTGGASTTLLSAVITDNDTDLKIGGSGSGTNKNIKIYSDGLGTLVGTFSSTGLAVTGTLSATGLLTVSTTGAVQNQIKIGQYENGSTSEVRLFAGNGAAYKGWVLVANANLAGGVELLQTTTVGGSSMATTAALGISSTGAVSINGGVQYGGSVFAALSAGTICGQFANTANGQQTLSIWNKDTTGDNSFISFATETAIANRGSISYNRAGGLTVYSTTSDYRLKEHIIDLPNALETVSKLKPRQFDWKETGNTTTGFIAHELAEVCPHAVTGEKDAVEMQQYEISPAIPATQDEEGNEVTAAVEAVMGEREVPRYQGIDTSFLVATLTAAIQEQQAIITALTTRITALEAK